MGYRTEQRMCPSCGGFGTTNSTEWVRNPYPGGQTTIPVTSKKTCFTCFGRGTTDHSVYVPDPVKQRPVSTDSSVSSKKERRSKKWKPEDDGLYPVGSEELKNADAKFAATIIAVPSALAFFFYRFNDFPTLTQGGILSAVIFVVIYFTLSKPLRGLTLALAKIVEVTFKFIGFILKAVICIAFILFVLYVIKEIL